MKVLVLSGRFGMGHEMAANAICEQFRKLDKDTEIVKKDLLEELYPHISKLIFGGFRLMVEHCHGIYNFIYKMSGKMKVEMQPRGAAIYKKLKKILEKEQPDVIVCTHPMCVKAIASYKEKFDTAGYMYYRYQHASGMESRSDRSVSGTYQGD